MSTLAEIRSRFQNDRFATQAAGIIIDEATEGYARCSMMLTPRHENARGKPMGGAIFTLADFAASVAANGFAEGEVAITLNGNINFLAEAKGECLIAKAHRVKHGRSTTVYSVDIFDDLETLVARATITGFVIPVEKA